MYIINRYEAVHNPAGKLLTMKDGNITLELFDLNISIRGFIPRLSVTLKSKRFSGRYKTYIIPPVRIRRSATSQSFLYITKSFISSTPVRDKKVA